MDFRCVALFRALFLVQQNKDVSFINLVHIIQKINHKMKVAVWDTYISKKDGSIMHFDIIAPEEIKDTSIIYNYGEKYLEKKGQAGQPLTTDECRFCHKETVRPQWKEDIQKNGYYIYEMENCE